MIPAIVITAFLGSLVAIWLLHRRAKLLERGRFKVPNQDAAVELVWHVVYGAPRTQEPPTVYWRMGKDLTIDRNGEGIMDGWIEPVTRQRVAGMTYSSRAVHCAWPGTYRSLADSSLAHELRHAYRLRFMGLLKGGFFHNEPDWHTGGEVERANRRLKEAGL